MEKNKKIRLWIGVIHLLFALILITLPLFMIGVELVDSWAPPKDAETPYYGGMVFGIIYIMMSALFFHFGLNLLVQALRWILFKGKSLVDKGVICKFEICFFLLLQSLLSRWIWGRVVYIALLLLFLLAAIMEFIYIEKLRAIAPSQETTRRRL